MERFPREGGTSSQEANYFSKCSRENVKQQFLILACSRAILSHSYTSQLYLLHLHLLTATGSLVNFFCKQVMFASYCIIALHLFSSAVERERKTSHYLCVQVTACNFKQTLVSCLFPLYNNFTARH